MKIKNPLFSLIILVGIVATAFCFDPLASITTAQGVWYAEYFANKDLVGGPVLTRYDDQLHFEWGESSPGAGVPADDFSARWTHDEWFEAGTLRFSFRADDGIRIWVGEQQIVDRWTNGPVTWSSVDYVVSRGMQRVRVEFFERGGDATIQVGWERISGGEGWQGAYYANRDMSGSPALTRADAAVDFDWGSGSPDPSVPADNFSARWTRNLGFTAGAYRFSSSCDDGVRVIVDGQRIIDAWGDASLPNTRSGDIYLTDGQHTVVVEYYEHGGDASAHVWWVRLGSYSGWEGRYYDNAELRGGPALVRDDAEINFDWGEGAPATWMPSDNFSALWTRQVNFAPGHYRFNVRSDDGVRVWLDGALVMDYWRVQDYPWHYMDGTFLEGIHTIQVEYFERTGSARIRFWWEQSSTTPSPGPGLTPTLAPGPTPAPTAPGPWTAHYFNNTTLSGEPALIRTDNSLSFDWDWESPAPEIKRDFFSARWTGTFWFSAGRYTFSTFSDDGVRLYVDDQPVIYSWRPMRGYRSGNINLSEGTHTVRVEYFERGGRANVRLAWQKSGQTVTLPSPVQPATCAGGPLQFDAWPVTTACTPGGWVATIFVQGHGGDCQYTYGWEGQVRGGPTPQSMTFEVHSAGWHTAIVGQAFASSAGQTVKRGLFIPHPVCP